MADNTVHYSNPYKIPGVITEEYSDQERRKADIDPYWWNSSSPHESVFPLVEGIRARQAYQSAQNLKYCRLYSNMDLAGLGFQNYTQRTAAPFKSNRLTLNIVQSCVDTSAAKIAKNKPRVQFLTKNGDYTEKRKAEKLTQFMEGMFHKTGIYSITSRAFVDACVLGTGAVKVYLEDDEIKCERVFAEELTVDDVEGMYGSPRQLHRTKMYSRDVLSAMFPRFRQEIRETTSVENSEQGVPDQVKVIESWHLRSGKEGKDGLHTICISSATLFEEEFTEDQFPFVFFRWIDKLLGFWGQGLAEQLVGIQVEINKVLQNIQAAQNLMCVPRIMVEEGSKVSPQMVTNIAGNFIRYRGTPPSFNVGSAMPTEMYSYLDKLIQRSYEFSGISQLSAAQKKPAGLDSGVALREYQDIESERFMLTAMRYEEMHLEVAKRIIDLARRLYTEDDIDLSVKTVTGKFLKSIKWSDVDMDDEEFTMQMFPVSLLPTTPAGKLQTVQELVQAGFMPREAAIGMLNLPDVDSWLAYQTADQDNIERVIGLILDKGKYTVPEKTWNLPMATEMCKQSIFMAQNDGVDEDRIDLLRTLQQAIDTLASSQALPNTAPPPGAPPIASPAPAPQSDLLPFQGQGQPQ